LVIILILLQIPFFLYPLVRIEAASEITPLKYYPDKNYRYFVGMMYYEMWKRTDGSWTDGGKKPNAGIRGEALFTYKFRFPNRKIKNVDARIYTSGDPEEYFEQSRSDRYADFEDAISIGT
ncbi:hypothetical protein KW823_26580, partial [Enterobacter quasiroggenkampii]|nr:hypothetical protein [Enterobacter quasiroggenkampii]